jgi:hypothetical protein
MVLVFDLDGNHPKRFEEAQERVPEDLRERVFILGILTYPERLRVALSKSYKMIGQDLAEDCRERAEKTWTAELLRHNLPEVKRLQQSVRTILFP